MHVYIHGLSLSRDIINVDRRGIRRMRARERGLILRYLRGRVNLTWSVVWGVCQVGPPAGQKNGNGNRQGR